MTFDEHVRNNMDSDGNYNLASAEADRIAEIEASEHDVHDMIVKAVKNERASWESRETQALRKVFSGGCVQGGLFDLEVLVPLGGSVAVEMGLMNEERIRTRKDLRTETHLAEIRAFDAEMTFWSQVLKLLPPGGIVSDIQS